MTTGGIIYFEREEIKDVPVRASIYNPHGKSDPERKRLFQEFRNRAEELEQRVRGGRDFVPEPDPLTVLSSFGPPSYVTVEYGCDNFVAWQASEIYHAFVKNGAQAKALIEEIAGVAGPMAQVKQGIGVPTNLESIRSLSAERAATGRKTLNLQFGASNPIMLWREMFHVYVSEAPQEPEETEQPRRWYQRLADRVMRR